MNQKTFEPHSLEQKKQFCNETLDKINSHHLQYVELSNSLSKIFSTNFDKEIADVSIALYRLHEKLAIQMMKNSHFQGEIQN